jgi:hypothetical protein
VREEEDDIVGSFVYGFSGGDRPIVECWEKGMLVARGGEKKINRRQAKPVSSCRSVENECNSMEGRKKESLLTEDMSRMNDSDSC